MLLRKCRFLDKVQQYCSIPIAKKLGSNLSYVGENLPFFSSIAGYKLGKLSFFNILLWHLHYIYLFILGRFHLEKNKLSW
jgi:hypothetical protein